MQKNKVVDSKQKMCYCHFMKSKIIISIVAAYSTCFAGMNKDTSKDVQKEVSPLLSIDEEHPIGDDTGKVNPNLIIGLKTKDIIKIILQDKTILTGIVTESQQINGDIVKIFGEITNKKNSGFGFALTKAGIFAGAVVFRDEDITYTLQQNKEDGAYYLTRQLKLQEKI
jgi:hypothetical protein